MSSIRTSFDAHAFCALPLVRRTYQALVVALAVFLLTLVILHEPFRGYLAEVHITGPATEGLNLDDAAAWLKQADPEVAVIANPAGRVSPKCLIRVTYVARLPAPAIKHLDDLSDRWLYQYLPDRLQSYRRVAMSDLRSVSQAAREREDAAHERLESLRQNQLVQVRHAAEAEAGRLIAQQPVPYSQYAPPPPEELDKSRQKLEALRLELSRLIASFTDEHPQVIALRWQIAALEKQLGAAPGDATQPAFKGPELISPATADQHTRVGPARGARHFVVANAVSFPAADQRNNIDADLAAQISAAASDLARASRDRQTAEQQFSERMQELSSQPTAAQWSAAAPHVVTRLGGTPRCSTLVLGGLLATIAGVVMFRAAKTAFQAPKIQSAAELATALELPVVGNTSFLRAATARRRRWLLTPGRVRAMLYSSEAVIGVAVAACIVSILVEPALARQVVADPFGALSEVLGRFA